VAQEIILKTEHIRKLYKIGENVIEALKDISIEITKGEFLSIVGKSGSGKSTLMHLMGLLDSPSAGTVYLNGSDVSKLEEKKLAQIRNDQIGFIFQSFNLLERANCIENVILPLKYSKMSQKEWKPKAIKMLELVGLGDRLYNKSNELSGGQKQRVAIARALVNEPSIVLADEPTGNLDSKTGDEILALFKKLNDEGKTIIVVTHDDEIATKTGRKIILKDGLVVS